jgi:hypothetical protein
MINTPDSKVGLLWHSLGAFALVSDVQQARLGAEPLSGVQLAETFILRQHEPGAVLGAGILIALTDLFKLTRQDS